MAILVEEEKKNNGNILAAFGWVVIIIIILVAAYYLFFVSPPPASVPPPAGFSALQPIAKITITPAQVASSTSFVGLHPAAPEPATSSPANVGRPNPFVAP